MTEAELASEALVCFSSNRRKKVSKNVHQFNDKLNARIQTG